MRDAEAAKLPIYVLRSNTPHQIRQFLNDLLPSERPARSNSLKAALTEAEEAVGQIKEGRIVANTKSDSTMEVEKCRIMSTDKDWPHYLWNG